MKGGGEKGRKKERGIRRKATPSRCIQHLPSPRKTIEGRGLEGIGMREEKTRKPGCNVATRQGNLSCCISKWMIMTSRVEEGEGAVVETVGSPCKQLQLPPP